MEIGTNINELFTDIEHKNINIEFKGKIWQFVIRDITWSEKNQIISKSAGISKSEATFDVNKYNQLYLEKCIIKAPFEMNKMNILKLNEEFGDLLVSKIVDKSENIEEQEMGN